jgi:tetratricopeptide (TPR) repeat protein
MQMNKNLASSGGSAVKEQLKAALALRASGALAEALEVLTGADEFDAALCFARGGIEFALGRFEEAALSYSAVALSQPANLDAQFNLALSFQRSGRSDVAAEAFERVLSVDSEWSEARLGLGGCLLDMNRAGEALENFDRACAGEHPSPGRHGGAAFFGKAVALQLLGRFEEAAEIYEKLLDSDPGLEEVYCNFIAMSSETHDLEGVRERSQRLLDVNSQSVTALRGLASAALHDGDHQAAVSYCSRLLDLTPDSLEAWHTFRVAIEQSPFGGAESVFAMHSGGKT